MVPILRVGASALQQTRRAGVGPGFPLPLPRRRFSICPNLGDTVGLVSPAVRPQPPSTAAPPDDFRALYESEFSYVWNSLRRLGVAPAHIEDVAHDVFVTAWKRLSDFDRSRPIRPWLFGIAFRVASDFRKRASNQREISGEVFDAEDDGRRPDEHVEQTQARALVVKALASIPMERRGVFVMHELDGHPIPHVAEAMGIPLNTAYSRLRLARADFAAAVKRLNLEGGAR